MLAPFESKLSKMRIILGSQSPRRRELLSPVLKFEVIPSNFDESTISPEQFSSPVEFVKAQAQKKCEELSSRIDSADMIITADTVVFIDNKVLGKPKSHQEAYEMLKLLNGRTHYVETGVCITMPKLNKAVTFSDETAIYFDDLPEDVMRLYADSDDPLDKAGGYGYSSYGISLVKKIDGDFGNSVGMPVNAICIQIRKLLQDS